MQLTHIPTALRNPRYARLYNLCAKNAENFTSLSTDGNNPDTGDQMFDSEPDQVVAEAVSRNEPSPLIQVSSKGWVSRVRAGQMGRTGAPAAAAVKAAAGVSCEHVSDAKYADGFE